MVPQFAEIINSSSDTLFCQSHIFLKKNDYDNYYIHLIMAANLGHKEAMHTIAKCTYPDHCYNKMFTEHFINFLEVTRDYSWSISFLGLAYYYGVIVSEDYKIAFELLSIGSNQGCYVATNNLASMYLEGHHVAIDYNKARQLFMDAMIENYANPVSNLGTLYYGGTGVDKDYAKALELFEIAAQQNCCTGVYNLAVMYYRGNGIEINYMKAEQLFKLAHKLGDSDALDMLLLMYKNTNKFDLDTIIAYVIEQNPKKLVNFGFSENIIDQIIKMRNQNLSLQTELENAQKQINDLTEHVKLSPGGSEYLELLEEWKKKLI